MDAGQVGMAQGHICRFLARCKYQVDHAIGQSCGPEYIHEHLGRVNLCLCRFPNDHVPHECGSRGKVEGNRGKIERADSIDKAFQRPLFQPVPGVAVVLGLNGINISHEINI